MRIIQTLTEQHMEAAFRTGLSAMSGEVTNETVTSDEEQIGIVI
jgi:hypothetical protein